MTTDIAKKALAIAKEKEIERLKMCKLEVHKVIDGEFANLLFKVTCFEGEHVFDFSDASKWEDDEIIAMCESIGFKAKKNPNSKHEFILSAPAITKEQEATEAQEIIFGHNRGVNMIKKAKDNEAKKLCQEIAKKIESGDFISNKKKDVPNTYEIQVEISGYANSIDLVIDKAKRLIEEMGFCNIQTLGRGQEWIFEVYDEE